MQDSLSWFPIPPFSQSTEMKKLKLELDELKVESFQTDRGASARGTVRGQGEGSYELGCPTMDPSCNGSCEGTCPGSCVGTCGGSCYGSCDATCFSCDYSCYESGCRCSVEWSGCGPYACP